jgi:GTP cyclohydrolase FolE2
VTGTVSLDAAKKGINMSRLMRSFYAYAEETFSFDVMERALDAYKADLGACDARLQMRFRFPVKVPSLRSGLWGFQYYDIALELVENGGVRKKIFHLDYVYASTCPCSWSSPSTPARPAASSPCRTPSARSRGCRSRCCRARAALVRGPDRHGPRRRCPPRRR